MHNEDSIQSKNTPIVLLSNDTDVLVLVLYFMQYFTSTGLEEFMNTIWNRVKKKDLYLSINYHINKLPTCVQIYSKHIS